MLTFRSLCIYITMKHARDLYSWRKRAKFGILSSLLTCYNSPSDLSKKLNWTWAIARNQHYLTAEQHTKRKGLQVALKIFQWLFKAFAKIISEKWKIESKLNSIFLRIKKKYKIQLKFHSVVIALNNPDTEKCRSEHLLRNMNPKAKCRNWLKNQRIHRSFH